MTLADCVEVMRRAQFWVEASVAEDGAPQAAVIGVVVSEQGELFFDTLATSRKAQNLRRDARMALVMWDGAATVQVEGLADEPRGVDLERLKALYLEKFPDGMEREGLPDLRYVRVRPRWLRLSDFAVVPPRIVELRLEGVV